MKTERQIAEQVFQLFRNTNCRENHGFMMNALNTQVVYNLNPKEQEMFYVVYIGLQALQYISVDDDGRFIRLTKKGYDYIYDDNLVNKMQAVPWVIPEYQNTNWIAAWNKLWKVIDSQPFYQSGPMFMKYICELDITVETDYYRYMEYRRDKELSTSRKDYFRDLIDGLDEAKRYEFYVKLQSLFEETVYSSATEMNSEKESDLVPFLDGHITSDRKEVNTKKIQKVFISYSWDNEDGNDEHKKWVKKLADDLNSMKGIEIIFDQYQQAGISLTSFMRDGIACADKVLIIGTPNYKAKAEAHSGGTNVEDQIINIHIYRDFDDPKFIPILRKGTFEKSFTDLVGDRKGFDFRNDSNYQGELHKLIQELIMENATLQIDDISTQNMDGLDKLKINQEALKDLFISVYIPYFTSLFDKLDIKDYKYWSYRLAVYGETEISYKRYVELRDLIVFCDSCQNQTNFEEYYNLTKCFQKVLIDLLNVFDLHSLLIGNKKFRFHKFYKDYPYDPQKNPIEEKTYIDEIWLIGDLTFELTRLANLLLEKIRIYDPGFMAQYGILTILDAPQPREPIVYKNEEKSDCPYLGLQNFLTDKMSRTHHYGEVDLINTLRYEGLI